MKVAIRNNINTLHILGNSYPLNSEFSRQNLIKEKNNYITRINNHISLVDDFNCFKYISYIKHFKIGVHKKKFGSNKRRLYVLLNRYKSRTKHLFSSFDILTKSYTDKYKSLKQNNIIFMANNKVMDKGIRCLILGPTTGGFEVLGKGSVFFIFKRHVGKNFKQAFYKVPMIVKKVQIPLKALVNTFLLKLLYPKIRYNFVNSRRRKIITVRTRFMLKDKKLLNAESRYLRNLLKKSKLGVRIYRGKKIKPRYGINKKK